MKKFIFLTIIPFVLIACNAQSGTNDETKDEDLDVQQVEETDEQNELVEEPEQPVEPEPTPEPDSGVQSKDVEVPTSGEKTSNGDANGNGEDKVDDKSESKHQEIVDLAYDIFDAQKNQDYGFLESIISKGTKIDTANNMFIFENVTYPHEQDFLTEADLGEIEFRFTHENNKDSVIAGFGLINYEQEMSFVVEFEFVNENGKWKMNDMDLNK